MAKPTPHSPPHAPDEASGDGLSPPPQTREQVRRGVLQQREHIQALDGEDPLRGGVDD
jgi:hypothetical protein